MMWGSKLKWLLLVHFLLSDKVHAQSPPFPSLKNSRGPITSAVGVTSPPTPLQLMTINQESEQEPEEKLKQKQKLIGRWEEEPNTDSAHHLISSLMASLHGQVHLQGNLSCTELVAGPWGGSSFPQVLLGLVMVPVLVSGGCVLEAQLLVLKLYTLLGEDDTQELLEDVVALMRHGREMPLHTFSTPPTPKAQSHCHLQAVMFNIHQLAEAGQKVNVLLHSKQEKYCQGFVRVKGTQLLGLTANHGEQLYLKQAKKVCKRLGIGCAGVTHKGTLYHVILRSGSRIVPAASPAQSESWIQSCEAGAMRSRRNALPQIGCMNENEKRVYNVVEWIPAVSTLYNLGTAVYYVSVNCSSTAKERAILGAVDLGTDALMAVTGGAVGVAGYAVGAGLKTSVKAGIKYLLNNMNQEHDLLMNQDSWESVTISSD